MSGGLEVEKAGSKSDVNDHPLRNCAEEEEEEEERS